MHWLLPFSLTLVPESSSWVSSCLVALVALLSPSLVKPARDRKMRLPTQPTFVSPTLILLLLAGMLHSSDLAIPGSNELKKSKSQKKTDTDNYLLIHEFCNWSDLVLQLNSCHILLEIQLKPCLPANTLHAKCTCETSTSCARNSTSKVSKLHWCTLQNNWVP